MTDKKSISKGRRTKTPSQIIDSEPLSYAQQATRKRKTKHLHVCHYSQFINSQSKSGDTGSHTKSFYEESAGHPYRLSTGKAKKKRTHVKRVTKASKYALASYIKGNRSCSNSGDKRESSVPKDRMKIVVKKPKD